VTPLDVLRRLVRRAVPPRITSAVKQRLGMPLTRLHPDWRILEPIGPVYRPHTIVDAGAHHGWFFHCWKDWCPPATVHAFEPAVEAFEEARRLYGSDPDIHIHNAALSREPGMLTLNVMEQSRVSSSFLMPVEETWREIDYHHGAIAPRRVPVHRLDDYDLGAVHLLKIDVQGFEIEVLEGATKTLARTDYVFVEAAIRPLYHGAPRFTTVHDWLDVHGFHLMAMRAWHRGNGTLVETDMLFRRNELMPPADPNVDRIMVQV
jgi:FkbM family methyltransferase